MRISMTQDHTFEIENGVRKTLPKGGVFNVEEEIGEEIIALGKGSDVNATNIPNPEPIIDDSTGSTVDIGPNSASASNADLDDSGNENTSLETEPTNQDPAELNNDNSSIVDQEVLTDSAVQSDEDSNDETILKIADAIEKLSPDDLNTKGLPKVMALTEKLGFKPSREQIADAIELQEK